MSLSEERAISIFEEVRDQPYRVSEFAGDSAPNCAFKGKQLLDRLGSIGFGVRGRIAEMRWQDTLVPADIVALYPSDLLATHFYIEVAGENGWRALDASWDRGLAKAGFPIATWQGENSPGFPLGRVYELEEQVAYNRLCNDPACVSDYFHRAGPFLKATNAWLKSIR